MTAADIFKLWCEATDALLEVEVEREGDDVIVSRVHLSEVPFGMVNVAVKFKLEPLWRCNLTDSGRALALVHAVVHESNPTTEDDHERMLEQFWLALGVGA